MKKSDIICVFVPYGVKHTFSEIDYPYKWEGDDGTYYSIMSKEEYEKYIEDDGDRIKKLEEENKSLKEEKEKLEEDNINLISFNEHYSPEVIVKYEDRYETAYKEECIENAKLCDKMRMLEEENRKLKEELGKFIMKS